MSGNLYVLSQIEKYLDLGSARWRLFGVLVKNRFFQTIARAKVNVSSHYDIPQDVLRCYLDRTYMSYSCAMFEEPTRLDGDELTRAGQGRDDTFDSLEKGQWRKFKDAVEFIDPRPGDTLLDVGCGYGGQLVVALESGPFGKVVGCTHSHNQTVFGRQLLSEFDASKWELHEADYREDSRVFDHVASTGMISHVGPRGLVPYVRNIRQRIRSGGRYLHHALMSIHTARSLDAAPGIAFNKKYVWPRVPLVHVRRPREGVGAERVSDSAGRQSVAALCQDRGGLVRANAPARRGYPRPREPGDVQGMADLSGRVLGIVHEQTLARVSSLLRGGLRGEVENEQLFLRGPLARRGAPVECGRTF